MKKLIVVLLLLVGSVSAVGQTATFNPALGWLDIPVVELPDGTKYYDVLMLLRPDGSYTLLDAYTEPPTTVPSGSVSNVCTSSMITAQKASLLTDGITVDEANQIIGCRGVIQGTLASGGHILDSYVWKGSGTYPQINSIFVDGIAGHFQYWNI